MMIYLMSIWLFSLSMKSVSAEGTEGVIANIPVAPTMMIPLGPRSMLSLLGIFILMVGVWYVDGRWDERGTRIYKHLYPNPSSETKLDYNAFKPALVFPWGFILGWNMIGFSHLLNTTGLQASIPGMFAFFFCFLLGIVASHPMAEAVRTRNEEKKKLLSLLFILSWMMLAIFSGLTDESGTIKARCEGLSLLFCCVGAFTIIMSMKILWQHRKMGDHWEIHGRPNPKPVVYSMGGPMFLFGFAMYWFGMNAEGVRFVNCEYESCGFPVFINWRTFLALVSGCGMVPVVMMVDYSHDTGSLPGVQGENFGPFYEGPFPFIIHWMIFGFTNLIDVYNGWSHVSYPRGWILFGLCTIQGIVAGVFLQNCVYRSDLSGKNRWSIVFIILFVMVTVFLGLTDDFELNGLAMLSAILGTNFVIFGQKFVFEDRIRGDYWMHQKEDVTNPDPKVYSFGEPIFMLGWLMMSLSVIVG